MKNRPFRHLKWWLQRANRHVPECDCWEFNDTIATMLDEGLTWMLEKGVSQSWRNEGTVEEQRADITFIRDTVREFLYYRYDGYPKIMHNKELWREHQNNLDKAFKLLAKYFWGLWD